ncbi:MAG: CTP synthase [Paludibacteraceae bacterium]|nr:CTP synthase [Paludibacteraceae bacterium]
MCRKTPSESKARENSFNTSFILNVKETKYIFVTGGVVSSLGKGITAASLGRLLQARGFKVTNQKLDPYINVDPGTLNPYEHGECYVTTDGYESDLDLGHYERFLNIETTRHNNLTTGRVYQSVINKERRGDYLGKTVQIIPHITDEIKTNIKALGKTGEYDFVITEIGGVVGDIESLPFIEAVRQLKYELGKNSLFIHLTYVPFIAAAKELKTKPTQHSVKTLQQEGIQPDVIVLRTEHPITDGVKRKVSQFCNVSEDAVIESMDCSSIYQCPVKMQEEGLDQVVLQKFGFTDYPEADMKEWNAFLSKMEKAQQKVRIALVGKYVQLQDAYKSISESLIHACTYNDRKLDLVYVSSEELTNENVTEQLDGIEGIIVAPGFGSRGIEGKFVALRYARENNVPCLGICLGMQCMAIEFARNVLGFSDANSTEIDPTTRHNIVDIMEEQKNVLNLGGSMRLGAYACKLKEDTLARRIYGADMVKERHRHRFEFNSDYRDQFEKAGMLCSGENPDTGLVEIIELPDKKFFLGTQFHPEYNSTVLRPNPLFLAFIKTIIS